jgi:hypothetical protein
VRQRVTRMQVLRWVGLRQRRAQCHITRAAHTHTNIATAPVPPSTRSPDFCGMHGTGPIAEGDDNDNEGILVYWEGCWNSIHSPAGQQW